MTSRIQSSDAPPQMRPNQHTQVRSHTRCQAQAACLAVMRKQLALLITPHSNRSEQGKTPAQLSSARSRYCRTHCTAAGGSTAVPRDRDQVGCRTDPHTHTGHKLQPDVSCCCCAVPNTKHQQVHAKQPPITTASCSRWMLG